MYFYSFFYNIISNYLLCNAGTDLLVCICCWGTVVSRPSLDGKSRSLMRRGPVTYKNSYI